MKMQFERSILINKPVADVYSIIADLGKWNTWSPWIHIEPTAKTELTGNAEEVGQSQTWNGEAIGSGRMTLAKLEKNKSISIKLEFYKPFKSVADIQFLTEEVRGGQTRVVWQMDGNMPFFMFFLKKMMIAFMSADFDRGLNMLKEYAETGNVTTKSVYLGQQEQKGFKVAGRKTTCAIRDLSKTMQTDFEQIRKLIEQGQFTPPQKTGALYHIYDIPKGVCEYTAALMYPAGQEVKAPQNYTVQSFSNHLTLKVDHFGPYRYLGNPWSMISAYQRSKKAKQSKEIPMYEIYLTMPDGRPEKDIHTQIFFPLK